MDVFSVQFFHIHFGTIFNVRGRGGGVEISPRSKFFALRADPILEGLRSPRKHTGSNKTCFPLIAKGKKEGASMHLYVTN